MVRSPSQRWCDNVQLWAVPALHVLLMCATLGASASGDGRPSGTPDSTPGPTGQSDSSGSDELPLSLDLTIVAVTLIVVLGLVSMATCFFCFLCKRCSHHAPTTTVFQNSLSVSLDAVSTPLPPTSHPSTHPTKLDPDPPPSPSDPRPPPYDPDPFPPSPPHPATPTPPRIPSSTPASPRPSRPRREELTDSLRSTCSIHTSQPSVGHGSLSTVFQASGKLVSSKVKALSDGDKVHIVTDFVYENRAAINPGGGVQTGVEEQGAYIVTPL